jgi:quercetin dioxygenase-like cupin family protein
MRRIAGFFALAFILSAPAVVAPAWGEDTSITKPAATVETLMATGETTLGQPIVYPPGAAKVTAAIVTVPPGGETGWHTHAVPLFGYILAGELTVDYGADGLHTYRPGDTLMEAMNHPHNGMNRGATEVRLLAVYMGSASLPNSSPAAP